MKQLLILLISFTPVLLGAQTLDLVDFNVKLKKDTIEITMQNHNDKVLIFDNLISQEWEKPFVEILHWYNICKLYATYKNSDNISSSNRFLIDYQRRMVGIQPDEALIRKYILVLQEEDIMSSQDSIEKVCLYYDKRSSAWNKKDIENLESIYVEIEGISFLEHDTSKFSEKQTLRSNTYYLTKENREYLMRMIDE